MRRRWWLLLLALFWCSGAGARPHGKPSRAAAVNASTRKLVSRVLTALGGEERLRRVRALRANYSVRIEEPGGKELSGSGEMDQVLPGKLRMDMTLDGVKSETVITDKAEFRRVGAQVTDASEENARWARQHMAGQILAPLFLLDALDRRTPISAILGVPYEGGGTCDVLQIQDDEPDAVTSVYLDPVSHLPIGLSMVPGTSSSLEDYRVVDGIRVAHRITQRMATGYVLESKVVSMTINPNLENSLFEK